MTVNGAGEAPSCAASGDAEAAAGGAGPRRVLVLGYGNPGREDDGLGPAAAAAIECLGLPGVVTYDNYQLVVEDAVEIAAADIVWFVDASVNCAEPFEVRALQAATEIELTSHAVKPEVLLALARTHYGRAPEAWIMGIRGYRFEFAEGMSDRSRINLQAAVARLTEQIHAAIAPTRSSL